VYAAELHRSSCTTLFGGRQPDRVTYRPFLGWARTLCGTPSVGYRPTWARARGNRELARPAARRKSIVTTAEPPQTIGCDGLVRPATVSRSTGSFFTSSMAPLRITPSSEMRSRTSSPSGPSRSLPSRRSRCGSLIDRVSRTSGRSPVCPDSCRQASGSSLPSSSHMSGCESVRLWRIPNRRSCSDRPRSSLLFRVTTQLQRSRSPSPCSSSAGAWQAHSSSAPP
jgi:hypothetical protein